METVEAVLFWSLLFFIAWNESATPQWAYTILFGFLLYFAIKAIVTKEEVAIWIYTANMAVILYLLYTFMKK